MSLFRTLLDLDDAALLDIVAAVMGEMLFAGSAAVEAVAATVGIDMAAQWKADYAFFDGIRDREVLVATLAEVAGEEVATANTKEKGATLKGLSRDHLDGSNGRAKVDGWVSGRLTFPPSAYTARGGVNCVRQRAIVAAVEITREAAAAERSVTGEGGAAVSPMPAAPEPDPEKLAA